MMGTGDQTTVDGRAVPNATGTGADGAPSTPAPRTRGQKRELAGGDTGGSTIKKPGSAIGREPPANAPANWGTSGRAQKRRAAQEALAVKGATKGPGKGASKGAILPWTASQPSWVPPVGWAPPQGGWVPPPNPGGKGPKGPKGGKGKGKGQGGMGPGWAQAPIPPPELAWFNTFAQWGNKANGGTRCLYFNSTVGCTNAHCNFVDLCLVCGQAHSAVSAHTVGDPQTG